MLHRGIGPVTTNQTFSIKDSVLWITGKLILGSITNQTFSVGGKSHIRWSDTVALVIGNDLDMSILEDSNTAK